MKLSKLTRNPWVQCPQIPSVQKLLESVRVVNYTRGAGEAKKRLDLLETLYREWVNDIVDLEDFRYCYFVNGVTDAINQWIATEDRSWQYFEGDYEYANMISGKGNKTKYLNNTDVLYVSNPACSTGNFIKLNDIPNPVILDCAYIGSTLKQKIEVPKTTEQIWFSFSKGWGLIGQRSGLVFTKQPHKSLHPMKRVEAWNYTSVETALAIVQNYNIDTVASEYKPVQRRLCEQYNLEPSDCFFIATSKDKAFEARRRIPNIARLDLSVLMNGEDDA
jgi:hypothetical protein|tara:strand:- start:4213 stop:5040 length:828 start_codon:yes stop_codon:yes gene_type:complete